jgi:flagellar biogenesis protein FliO
MRSALVLFPEAGLGTGPDLTRYLVVCAGSILGLVALAYVFKRTLAQHLLRRAAQRSLQVLDVLPLSGKQKLVVVRCYDRSFLLGLGEKEVRSIAELELELPAPAPERAPSGAERGAGLPSFVSVLRDQLDPGRPARIQQRSGALTGALDVDATRVPTSASANPPAPPRARLEEGLVA